MCASLLAPSRLRPPWRAEVSEATIPGREGVTFADVLKPRSQHGAPSDRSGLAGLLAAAGFDVRDESVLTAAPHTPEPGTTLVLWAGTLGDSSASAEPSPRNWTSGAWQALDEALGRWVEAGAADRLLVRTHAAHIVSDIPTSVRFARTWGPRGIRLCYDPASMLTGEMASTANAATHLERLIDALEHPDLGPGIGSVLLLEGFGPWDAALIESTRARCAAMGVRTFPATGSA